MRSKYIFYKLNLPFFCPANIQWNYLKKLSFNYMSQKSYYPAAIIRNNRTLLVDNTCALILWKRLRTSLRLQTPLNWQGNWTLQTQIAITTMGEIKYRHYLVYAWPWNHLIAAYLLEPGRDSFRPFEQNFLVKLWLESASVGDSKETHLKDWHHPD